MQSTLYITEHGALALQASGYPGWTTDGIVRMVTALPAPPGRRAVFADFVIGTLTSNGPATLFQEVGPALDPATGGIYVTLDTGGNWTGPGDASGQDIVGLVCHSPAHAVYFFVAFDSPVSMRTPLDVMVPRFTLFERSTTNAYFSAPPPPAG